MKCKIKAKGCLGTYEKWTANLMLGGCCPNTECKVEKMMRNHEKSEAKKAKKERATTRKQMEAAKTTRQLLKEAEVYCNRFILLRDKGKPCISCGKSANSGKMDCGHYIAVGSGAHWPVRFHWANMAAQCSRYCNTGLSGNIVEYRKALLKKHGAEMVEYLENHPAYSFTREDAIDIKLHYMAECRRLKQEME